VLGRSSYSADAAQFFVPTATRSREVRARRGQIWTSPLETITTARATGGTASAASRSAAVHWRSLSRRVHRRYRVWRRMPGGRLGLVRYEGIPPIPNEGLERATHPIATDPTRLLTDYGRRLDFLAASRSLRIARRSHSAGLIPASRAASAIFSKDPSGSRRLYDSG